MNTVAKEKTSIYLTPVVKDFLQHKAVEEKTSVSALVNDYFHELIEDTIDKSIAKKRKNEPVTTFSDMLTELNLTYDDLRD